MLSHILLKLYILQYQLCRHGIACIFQLKKKKRMMRIMIMIDQYMYHFYLILTKFFKSYIF